MITGNLIKGNTYLKCMEKNYVKSILTVKRYLSTNSDFRKRLLQIRNVQQNINLKNSIRYPNLVKSSSSQDKSYLQATIQEKVWNRAVQLADKVALVCAVTGREIKYWEVEQESKRIAVSLLTKLGLTPGEVIAFILPNIPEYPLLLLGAFEAGIVVTTINPVYSASEIAHQLKDSNAVAAITIYEKLPILRKSISKLKRSNFKIITLSNIGESNSHLLSEGLHSYSELVCSKTDIRLLDSLKNKSLTNDDTFLILYSSGTTGSPKGVCLSQNNMLATLSSFNYAQPILEATNNFQDVVCVLIPMFHLYGFCVTLTGLQNGAKLITLPKFEEKSLMKAITDHKIKTFPLVPPVLIYLGSNPTVTKQQLGSLELIITGAAPIAESDIQKFLRKLPENVKLLQAYGSTESGLCTTSIRYDKNGPNFKTVGRATPSTKIKIVDFETGQIVGPNKEGEICIKGPQVMKCYLNQPEANKESFDKDGWFRTGDTGYCDEDGYYYITDRLKEIIKVKAFQVSPAEVEGVLRSHPDVMDAGVIGVPHPTSGEVPVAFIQTDIKDEGKMIAKLEEHLNKRLAKYKHVSKYFFIDSIPKTASGKILRKDLKAFYYRLLNKY